MRKRVKHKAERGVMRGKTGRIRHMLAMPGESGRYYLIQWDTPLPGAKQAHEGGHRACDVEIIGGDDEET